jgi:non-heme chloroperoxidase
VIDFLRLNQPVLAGHSLGGEQLSSVGSRHPEKVAGLIYLDAGYSYAWYDGSRGDLNTDASSNQPQPLTLTLEQAVLAGMQRYTDIPVPVLAIFAWSEAVEAQAKSLETGLPSARVVRLTNANHYVFESNESDVLREMNAFINSLP